MCLGSRDGILAAGSEPNDHPGCSQRRARGSNPEKEAGAPDLLRNTNTHRKEKTMSNQPENEKLQTMTPEEIRQHLLAEVEVTQQAITELRDEDLEAIAGGNLLGGGFAVGKRLTFAGNSIKNSITSYKNSPFKQFLVQKVLPRLL
jgi:hypothetical protein